MAWLLAKPRICSKCKQRVILSLPPSPGGADTFDIGGDREGGGGAEVARVGIFNLVFHILGATRSLVCAERRRWWGARGSGGSGRAPPPAWHGSRPPGTSAFNPRRPPQPTPPHPGRGAWAPGPASPLLPRLQNGRQGQRSIWKPGGNIEKMAARALMSSVAWPPRAAGVGRVPACRPQSGPRGLWGPPRRLFGPDAPKPPVPKPPWSPRTPRVQPKAARSPPGPALGPAGGGGRPLP